MKKIFSVALMIASLLSLALPAASKPGDPTDKTNVPFCQYLTSNPCDYCIKITTADYVYIGFISMSEI